MTDNAVPYDKPLVSILTPTWNRATYLERVWKSLNSQTHINIEWVVADDGSSDETESVVRELAARSDFPVVLIKASVHIGKARMDNEAIAQAKGEFILWNDSDDYLLPHAVEQLVESWYSIPESDRGDYVGVTALCANEYGVISSPLPHEGPFDTTWNDLAEKYKVTGDKLHFTKASALKNHPFPEVDLYIPEGVMWTTLGNLKIRISPEVLQIKEYRAPHCVSFSGKMEYSCGRAYAMATSELNLQSYPRNLKRRLWMLITYIRCSLHGEIRSRDQVRMWADNSPKSLFVLMWPVGWLLALKDRLQRKVRMTHREFHAAEKLVTISYNYLGRDLHIE